MSPELKHMTQQYRTGPNMTQHDPAGPNMTQQDPTTLRHGNTTLTHMKRWAAPEQEAANS